MAHGGLSVSATTRTSLGDQRHDNRLSAIARAVWTADWLTRRIQECGDRLRGRLVPDYSNLSFEAVTPYWEVGPSVLLAWHF